jgi:hypothetical protein
MPKSLSSAEPPRLRRARAGAESGAPLLTTENSTLAPEAGDAPTTVEPAALPATGALAIHENGNSSATSRFRIFIVDSGWSSAARRVLHENFALIRDLQKDDPIYVLSREKSIEFMRRYGSRIGRDPIIAVHDMQALNKGGTTGFHGFRLSLGLLRTAEQALMGLQAFARFLVEHRHSADLEADIRARLRREGLSGAIEIAMHHEAREIGE